MADREPKSLIKVSGSHSMATSPSVCRGLGTYGAPKAPFWTTILNQIPHLVSSDTRISPRDARRSISPRLVNATEAAAYLGYASTEVLKHLPVKPIQLNTQGPGSAVLAQVTPRARYAIRLAAATGLRRGDLVALRWDQVHANRIELDTAKSRGKTFVIAPLVGDGAAVIEELRRERELQIADGRIPSAFVLTTGRGTAWLGESLTQAFIRGAKEAGVPKALHDLRGTAATRYILGGFSPQEVASFIGWERSRVDKIIRRYVDPDRIARAAIDRLEPKLGTG